MNRSLLLKETVRSLEQSIHDMYAEFEFAVLESAATVNAFNPSSKRDEGEGREDGAGGFGNGGEKETPEWDSSAASSLSSKMDLTESFVTAVEDLDGDEVLRRVQRSSSGLVLFSSVPRVSVVWNGGTGDGSAREGGFMRAGSVILEEGRMDGEVAGREEREEGGHGEEGDEEVEEEDVAEMEAEVDFLTTLFPNWTIGPLIGTGNMSCCFS
jgi:hypothetical protein